MSALPSRPDTIWVPRTLAAGILRPEPALKALAGLARRGNTSLEMTWRSSDIAARTGATSARSGRKVLDALAAVPVSRHSDDVRLVTNIDGGVGTGFRVTFGAVPHNERLELPHAALWEHQWLDGRVTGPRYGKDTGRVAQFLLAILAAGTWDKAANTVVCDLPVVSTRDNRSISHISGLSADKFERAWAVVYEVCKDDPWLIWEQTYRADGGQHTWRYTLDWNLLPALTKPEGAATGSAETSEVKPADPDTFCGPGLTLSAEPVSHLLRGHIEVSSSSQSFGVTSSPPARVAETDAVAAATKAGRVEEAEATVEDLRVQDVLTNGLDSQHARGPETDHTTATLDEWVLTLVAALVDRSTSNPIPLRRADIPALTDLTRPKFEAGWSATILAERLTEMSSPTKDALKALDWRIRKKVPDVVNFQPGTAATAQQLADEAAYQALASCRDASTYTQRTM